MKAFIFLKNILRCVCFIAVAMLLFSCKAPEDEALRSLGEYKNSVCFTYGEFQDYTDYAKYYYDSVDLAENEYFEKIQEFDLAEIVEHLDDFESWIEAYREDDASSKIVVNYDFDRSIIDTQDYFYIHSKKLTSILDDGTVITTLANYDVLFFDTQTLVLYRFHNNK